MFVSFVVSGAAQAAVTIDDGKYLYFGRYDHCTGTVDTYQGVEAPILWQKKNDTLYLSHYLLDRKRWGPYDEIHNVHWTGADDGSLSNLRTWLNDGTVNVGFIGKAFDANEQTLLQIGVDSDGDTEAPSARVTIPASSGVMFSLYGSAGYRGASGNTMYWTRSPGDGSLVWAVYDDGGEMLFGGKATLAEFAPLSL